MLAESVRDDSRAIELASLRWRGGHDSTRRDNWISTQARTYKPPGARYCDWCNAVFYEFDHTCPWTGTAIARNNMRSFRSFVALVQLELWCTIAVVILWFSELVPR